MPDATCLQTSFCLFACWFALWNLAFNWIMLNCLSPVHIVSETVECQTRLDGLSTVDSGLLNLFPILDKEV